MPFRQHTFPDGTVRIACARCRETRDFRSPLLLRKWKARHPGECPGDRGAA